MSIQITNPIRIAGVEQAIGTQLTLDPSLEADLVNRRCAIYLSIPDGHVDPVIRSTLNLASGAQIKAIWVGTQAQYDAIAVKDANTQYNTDSGIYVGDTLVSGGGDGGGPYVPKVDYTTAGGPAVNVFRVVSDTHPDAPAKIAVTPGAVFTGDGQSFNDPAMYVGFFNEGSSPSHGIIMEQDYWFDSGLGVFKHKSELHHVFITSDGVQRRPLSWTGQYDTGFIDFSISTNQLNIADPTSGNVYLQFLPSSQIVFGVPGSNVRIRPGASGKLLSGGSITYNDTNGHYEATAYNPAGIVAGEGVIDFYCAIAQTTGSEQTRKGGINGSGNFDVIGDVKAGKKFVIGSNALEIVQNGWSIQFNDNFLLGPGTVSGFGSAVDGNVVVNIAATGNSKLAVRIAPFSAGQTADMFSTISNSGEPKFGVLAGGTPISEDATQGVILRSNNSHYWRFTVSDAGTPVFIDLGTTRPTV